MENLSDRYCIDRALAGDTEAFAPIVSRYGKPVFALIVRVVGSREDAEELAQDVFLKALRSLRSFRGDSSFGTWLYRIAWNMALSAKRKKTPEAPAFDEEALLNVPDETPEPGDDDPTEERVAALHRALELLPPDERAIIGMFYRDDRSIAEIAAITGMNEGNVKTKIFRIRRRLQVLMEKEKLKNGE
jgi:RNA polymerase sigma-70 factor (ECF subfamily)